MDVRKSDPREDGYGRMLYEHWETGSHGPWLLMVASTPNEMRLKPGDYILTRRWVPADPVPVVLNSAKKDDTND